MGKDLIPGVKHNLGQLFLPRRLGGYLRRGWLKWGRGRGVGRSLRYRLREITGSLMLRLKLRLRLKLKLRLRLRLKLRRSLGFLNLSLTQRNARLLHSTDA